MTDKPASIVAWAEKADRCVTLTMSSRDLRTTIHLEPERARKLIAELSDALDRLPATLTAADLGIEGAPV